MKFTIATAALLFALGTTAPAYAQHDDKGDGGHSQGEHSQAAHSQAAKPATQQRTQQAAHTGRPQTNAVNHSQQHAGGGSQANVHQTHASGVNAGNRGNYTHGRISDAHYASNFGSGHSFRVNRGDYDRRRFAYGGYSFGFIDPWPVGWGYTDDVYVVYDGGGYFMYDRFHPGFRISLNIL